MKKTIRDFKLYDKKVIIRVDFNVPIKDNKILDDNRILESLNTIKYAINNGAKVILMSHLGRIKTEEDKKNNSLRIVASRLNELLLKDVIFIDETRGEKLEHAIDCMKVGDVLLMENTRFQDLNDSAESKCNPDLASYWASLGEIFINDAFGTIHRAHASNVGISKLLPSGIGFLIEKELKNLYPLVNNSELPFTVILGGAKIADKIKLLENLVTKADYILIGGGMAFTFLKSEGYNIGSSIVDLDSLDFCHKLLEQYPNKIILPVDIICATKISDLVDTKISDIASMNMEDIGLDIGPKTIEIMKHYIDSSKSIFFNGTLGMTEYNNFKNGTLKIAEYLQNDSKKVIIGGGDTAAAIINFGFKNKYTHISTGGGASLELLEGKSLSGLDAIEDI